MKPKPDDRRDNARKIRNNIDNTVENKPKVMSYDNIHMICRLKMKEEKKLWKECVRN